MIKTIYRKFYRTWLGKPLSIDEFRHVLINLLGVSKGDSVLVHSSFGNLKASFSPKNAVEVLMETVGIEGNILMPYYPSDSKKWLEEGKLFDVRKTPTRSGIISATFAKFPDVKKSLHPIKSMAVWGKDRDFLISEHMYSKEPFDLNSPTYKMLQLNNSKSIGLGVYKYLLMHMAEDIIEKHPQYYSSKHFDAKVIDYEGNEITVSSQYHKDVKIVPAGEYLHLTNCPGFNELKYRKRRFYYSDAKQFFTHMEIMAEKQKTALHIKRPLRRYLISKINRI